MEHERIQSYFSRYAEGFDAIYTGEKNALLRLLDKTLRRDMFMRLALTLETCGDIRGKRVLDVGCGPGQYSLELARRGAHATGIDFAGPMVKLADQKARQADLPVQPSFVQGNFLDYPLDGTYDVTLAIGFFDYTEEPAPFLSRAYELTGERLIATFPKRWTYRAPIRKVRLGLLGCPVFFYSSSQVKRLIQDAGFTVSRLVRLPASWWVDACPQKNVKS